MQKYLKIYEKAISQHESRVDLLKHKLNKILIKKFLEIKFKSKEEFVENIKFLLEKFDISCLNTVKDPKGVRLICVNFY